MVDTRGVIRLGMPGKLKLYITMYVLKYIIIIIIYVIVISH